MVPFVKKDVLLLWRDRKVFVILILMPFVLIAILGFALGGLINNSVPALDMTVILVNEEDEAKGFERFAQDIRAASLPKEAQDRLLAAAESLRPQQLLRKMLGSEQLANVVRLSEMDRDAARQALKRDEAAAVVIVPPDFTYNTLNKMLLDRGEGAVVALETSEASPLKAGIFHDILDSFVRSVNFQTALQQTTARNFVAEEAAAMPAVQGGVEFLSASEPVTSIQYYTFGMAVMFVLFVASSIAARAYLEKRNSTYDRIMISGAHPLRFLGGKAVSAALLAFIQLAVLFTLSTLVFQSFAGQPAKFWTGILVVNVALAVCIGALSALLTALNIRLETAAATNLFASMVVAVLSFLGGSFFPTSQIADWIGAWGEWTPNGAALASYLHVMRGADAGRWMSAVYRLLAEAVCLMTVSVWIFPKRKAG